MAGRNILVLDLETQKSFKEVGRDQLEKLKVSVVGIYDYLTGEYEIYEEKDILRLNQRLKNVGLLIGFNIKKFDLPVLSPYLFCQTEDFPVLDLLLDVEKVRGHRASLESIASPTLRCRKSGRGEDAIVFFRENRIEELKKYCLQDVRLTKDIYEFGCENGKILFTSNLDYQTYEIPVNWKEATEEMLAQGSANRSNFPSSLF
jgi:DEAD/DEAH box helicase domain-containing protein